MAQEVGKEECTWTEDGTKAMNRGQSETGHLVTCTVDSQEILFFRNLFPYVTTVGKWALVTELLIKLCLSQRACDRKQGEMEWNGWMDRWTDGRTE